MSVTDSDFDEQQLHRCSHVAEMQWHTFGNDLKLEKYRQASARIMVIEEDMKLMITGILQEVGIPKEDWDFTIYVMSRRGQ